jgi:hypothetical protein
LSVLVKSNGMSTVNQYIEEQSYNNVQLQTDAKGDKSVAFDSYIECHAR